MPQDLPPVGGYEPVQYKVCFCCPLLPGNPNDLNLLGRMRRRDGTTGDCDLGFERAIEADVRAEKPSCERIPPGGDARRGIWRVCIRVLQGWEGD